MRDFLAASLVAMLLTLSASANAESPRNDAAAMKEAANLLRAGESMRAIALWQPLAERGNVDAQFNLGTVYLHGDGVAVNESEALKWFRRAAERGDRQAQQQLGVMILHGRGTAADPAEGYRWINRKHHEHHEHAHHLTAERQRAAALIWESEMKASYARSQVDNGAQVIAELKRRAGSGENPATRLAQR